MRSLPPGAVPPETKTASKNAKKRRNKKSGKAGGDGEGEAEEAPSSPAGDDPSAGGIASLPPTGMSLRK